jgi:hypothetical protein
MQRQGGIGALGLLFFLALAVFFLTIGMKLGPHYMDYLQIRSLMQSLNEDPSLVKRGKRGLRRAIDDRLNVNYIYTVKTKDFKIDQTNEGYRVSVKYKIQEPLFANVDVLLSFDHQVQVGKK